MVREVVSPGRPERKQVELTRDLGGVPEHGDQLDLLDLHSTGDVELHLVESPVAVVGQPRYGSPDRHENQRPRWRWQTGAIGVDQSIEAGRVRLHVLDPQTKREWTYLRGQFIELRVGIAQGARRLWYDDVVGQSQPIPVETHPPFAQETEVVDPDGIRRAGILEHPTRRLRRTGDGRRGDGCLVLLLGPRRCFLGYGRRVLSAVCRRI